MSADSQHAVQVDHVGRIFAIVTSPVRIGDEVRHFEEAVRAPGVRVIAVDRAAGVVHLTRERRRELDAWDWRMPGGKVFDHIDEYLPLYLRHKGDPEALQARLLPHVLDTVGREAREEAGLTLGDIEIIGRAVCGGTVHWDLYFALANVVAAAENALEPGEEISGVEAVPFRSALELIDAGEVREERAAVWLRRTVRRLMLELPHAR